MIAGKIADTFGYGWLFAIATAISAVAVIATVRMIAAADAGQRLRST
jgi:PAT family beta-lactamase induction signal transducer AmpG